MKLHATMASCAGLLVAGLVSIHLVRSGIAEPTEERLWTNAAPGSAGDAPEDTPSVSVFLPSRWTAAGAAMIICPGGAYQRLMGYEGEDIARWLNSFGVAGFVLRYRIAPRYHHPAPLLMHCAPCDMCERMPEGLESVQTAWGLSVSPRAGTWLRR